MTEIWLVRHGQTDWNLTGKWQGQSPNAPGLNDTGREQALIAREQLLGKKFSAIYSSDLLRSLQTAELIAEHLGLAVNSDPRLREMNLGAWEGLFRDEIEKQYPQDLAACAQNPFYAHTTKGESPHDVAERVLTAINELASKHRDESILVVAHGISLAVIICHTQGFPMEEVYNHLPKNAQPYCVYWPD